jgi:hypothetical protein
MFLIILIDIYWGYGSGLIGLLAGLTALVEVAHWLPDLPEPVLEADLLGDAVPVLYKIVFGNNVL